MLATIRLISLFVNGAVTREQNVEVLRVSLQLQRSFFLRSVSVLFPASGSEPVGQWDWLFASLAHLLSVGAGASNDLVFVDAFVEELAEDFPGGLILHWRFLG
jgi:hypothetical protein